MYTLVRQNVHNYDENRYSPSLLTLQRSFCFWWYPIRRNYTQFCLKKTSKLCWKAETSIQWQNLFPAQPHLAPSFFSPRTWETLGTNLLLFRTFSTTGQGKAADDYFLLLLILLLLTFWAKKTEKVSLFGYFSRENLLYNFNLILDYTFKISCLSIIRT